MRGAPEDSIPLTHEAQADIWRHQHPEHRCAGDKTRFLVSYWDNPHFHGMGSHLHLMTAVLGLAVTYGRVFGLLNYSFHRAQHEGCRGETTSAHSLQGPSCLTLVQCIHVLGWLHHSFPLAQSTTAGGGKATAAQFLKGFLLAFVFLYSFSPLFCCTLSLVCPTGP